MSELQFKNATDYALYKIDDRNKKMKVKQGDNTLFNFCVEDFKAGAEWHKNSIWHDVNDRSIIARNDEDLMLLLENGKIVDYDDDWEEYYSPVIMWAYKKDLIPNVKK